MKQKIKNKFIFIFKISFLLSFLLVEFFGFGMVTKIFAASATGDCYNIDGMQAKEAQITKTSTSIFDFKVTRVSSTGYCVNENHPKASWFAKQSGIFTDDQLLVSTTLDFTNAGTKSVQSSVSYSWSQFPSAAWNNLPTANVIEYYMNISMVNVGNRGASTKNWGKTLAVTTSAPPASGTGTYGCLGSDSAVHCSAGGKSDCSDIADKQNVCIFPCGPVDPSQCSKPTGQKPPNNASQPAALPVGTSYACLGADSTAHCSQSGKSDCSDATGCASGASCVQVFNTQCNTKVTAAPDTSQNAAGQAGNSATTLYNPIQGVDSLRALLVSIMKAFLGMVAVWAVAFIVIGGFRMVISQGNEENLLAAKKTITWAVLGLLAAVLSFAIIAIVQNLIGVKIPPPTTTYNVVDGHHRG